MVCRYNFGSDLVVIHLGPDGKVSGKQVGILGLTGLNSPLDLTQDPANGNLYVSEFGAERITLLRPAGTGGGTPPVAGQPAAGPPAAPVGP
jgi:hypothetical protein